MNGRGRGALACLALALAGCGDGYPTADVSGTPAVAPEGLVESLNALGVEPGASERWKYQSDEPCSLQVTSTRSDGRTDTIVVRLTGHWVNVRADPDVAGFAVQLEPLAEPDSPEVRVFSAPEWRQASAASSLIQRLIAACKDGA